MSRIERLQNCRHVSLSGWPRWLAALIAVLSLTAAGATAARAETRSLKFYHLHTHEKAEIVYKRNGRYDPEGLRKINYILRDWRRNEPVKMDPRLLDLVWEAYRATGSHEYINVICGYRAPETNSMLRSRSRGVAKKSQHVLGKALDFYIPGVSLKKLRDIGLRMQGGGVGYYPTSGSPFVHMDVGNVRHWPGISRQELARIFPNGKTLHVPSDGKPLPGYEQALAAYKARKADGEPAIALASAGGSGGKSGNWLASLFGGGQDEADDMADVADDTPAPAAKNGRTEIASAAKPAAKSLPGIKIVSPKDADRADIPQVAEEETPKQETPETIIAALPARDIPLPGFAPRPKADVGAETPETVPFGMADASATTAATPGAASAARSDAISGVQVASVTPTPSLPVSVPFGIAAAVPPSETANPVQAAVNNVPLPTWRPDPAAGKAIAPTQSGNQQAVLLALASPVEHPVASDAFNVLPTARPADAAAVAESVDEVKAVLERVAATDEYKVAALTRPRSVFDGSLDDEDTPRKAVASRPAGSDPASAIGGSVKTAPKQARVTAQDLKPAAKPVVVAAQPDAARWALTSHDEVITVSGATTAPRYAYNIVYSAPTEIYANGFQSGHEMASANRFTGSAVNFMSVAKFKAE